MNSKRFDPELYAKNDSLGKQSLRNILEGSMFQAIESNKRTDVDFAINVGGVHVCYVEVEIKARFEGQTFIYPNLQIPARKSKYTRLSKPTIFVVFNKTGDHYMTVHGSDLLDSKIKVIKNKYVFDGEEFFIVEMNKVGTDNLLDILNKLIK